MRSETALAVGGWVGGGGSGKDRRRADLGGDRAPHGGCLSDRDMGSMPTGRQAQRAFLLWPLWRPHFIMRHHRADTDAIPALEALAL